MRDRIIVDKSRIPCRFNITLGNTSYEMEFKYNKTADFFTVGLALSDGTMISSGEPLVYGMPLFAKIAYRKNVPAVMIVPCDEAGEHDVVNWESFGEYVFLEIFNTDDLTVWYSNNITTNAVNHDTAQTSFVAVKSEKIKQLVDAIKGAGAAVDSDDIDDIIKAVKRL